MTLSSPRFARMRSTIAPASMPAISAQTKFASCNRLQTNPVMMKFQRIAPQFVAEASQLAMPEVLSRMPELQRRIGAAIDEWLARHPAERHPTT